LVAQCLRLDVKIISPPHVLLFLGGVGIRFGVWLLLLREQNRGAAPQPGCFASSAG